ELRNRAPLPVGEQAVCAEPLRRPQGDVLRLERDRHVENERRLRGIYASDARLTDEESGIGDVDSGFRLVEFDDAHRDVAMVFLKALQREIIANRPLASAKPSGYDEGDEIVGALHGRLPYTDSGHRFGYSQLPTVRAGSMPTFSAAAATERHTSS